MEESQEPLSGNQSLHIITDMIRTAKGNITQASFYFLLWGWVVMAANLGHYILQEIVGFYAPYLVWIICIPAMIVSMIYGYKTYGGMPAKSHLNNIYTKVWIAFLVSLFIVLVFFSNPAGQYILNPIILVLAACATFISGIILKFNPLIIGGILFWIFAIISFAIRNNEAYDQYQFLISAFAIFTGYLIPGYILKRKNQ